ncbi:O-antigen ligase family protein [uncultured Pseudokineococcus sp.]|uniref:O-antigen ligase family protein n=1 Tax=uncultured Pseudokineococcus sp. TaxID=1642928 RepID=UPI00261925F0|nr:O-antigen ligase family protein [uncultured Pseudokineococcus sp.]
MTGAATAGACVVGAALVAAGPRWAVVLAVVGAALLATWERDTAARLALVLVPLVALVRRLTGGPNAYVENDPLVLLVPLLIAPALAGLLRLEGDRRLARGRWLWIGLIGYWAGITLVQPGGSLVVRLFGIVSVLLPAALGYAVFEGLHQRLPRFALLSVLLLAPLAAIYGVLQYFVNPPWDLAWLADRQGDLISVGMPEPGAYRVFGSLEAPLPFALYLGLGLVALAAWALWARPGARALPLAVPAAVVVVVALVLTATRSVLFGLPLVAALAVLALPGRRRVAALALTAVVAVATLVVPAVVADQLYAGDERQADRLRVDQVGEDTSLLARLDLLDEFTDVLAAPLGSGLGTSGQATRLAGEEGADNVDNGYLSIAQETGVVGAGLFVALGLTAAVRGRRLLQERMTPARGFATGGSYLVVVYFLVLLLTGAVLSSSSAVLFWVALGLVTRETSLRADEASQTVRLAEARATATTRRSDGGPSPRR